MQLHRASPAFEKGGASLFLIGNGTPKHAQWFREDTGIDVPLLCDEKLEAYAAAGLRRTALGILHPGAAVAAVRALAGGNFQSRTKGDPYQQGGVVVADFPDRVRYHHVARYAGDRAKIQKILSAIGVIG